MLYINARQTLACHITFHHVLADLNIVRWNGSTLSWRWAVTAMSLSVADIRPVACIGRHYVPLSCRSASLYRYFNTKYYLSSRRYVCFIPIVIALYVLSFDLNSFIVLKPANIFIDVQTSAIYYSFRKLSWKWTYPKQSSSLLDS